MTRTAIVTVLAVLVLGLFMLGELSPRARRPYSTDLGGLPSGSALALEGLKLWIVDALRYTPHPSHFSVADTLGWIDRLRPERAILTNLHSDLDYATLRAQLPLNVQPAFDGLKIELADKTMS